MRQSNLLRTVLGAGLMMVCAQVSVAQNARITGRVTDPSEAVVPGTEIKVINENTGIEHSTTSNESGYYVVPLLNPGTYRVTAQKEGFRPVSRTGIKLDVAQVARIDFVLELGAVTEQVTVIQTAPLLATERPTIGQVIENKRIVDLPLNGRDPFSLANLTPGVNPAGKGSTPQMAGGRNANSEVQIDGVTNVAPENNVGINYLVYTPQVDAVQEFTVEVNALSAEYGRFSGGVINLVTKSGTNRFHGTVYEFFRNSKLDANNFFANRAGRGKGSFKRNQWGGTIGGPIARDKAFFFFGFEGTNARIQRVFTGTVPLAPWRRGDFSDLKTAQGEPITIFDPLTVKEDPNRPGVFIRDPFPGNRIPEARFSSVAMNVMKYFPEPNAPPRDPYTGTGNFVNVGSNANDSYRSDSRVDVNLSEKWRMFGRASFWWGRFTPFEPYGNGVGPTGGPAENFRANITLNNTFTFSPTLIGNLRYGFGRSNNRRSPYSEGFDLRELGFPQNLYDAAARQILIFPRFSFRGVASSVGPNNWTTLRMAPMVHTVSGSITKIAGAHTIKIGGEYRKLLLNFFQIGRPAGDFMFSQGWTQQRIDRARKRQGFPLASFLLGLPRGGRIHHEPSVATASSYFAGFIQDDWKVTSKLTLHLGLRYDVDVPRTERYNRLSFFDIDAPSPIAGQVPPSPYCLQCDDLRGAMRFVDDNNRRQTPTDRNNFGPRFGFAYKVTGRMVIRGGYGISYGPSVMQAAGTTGTAGMEGFRSSTSGIYTLDRGQTIYTTLDDPFPDGFYYPPGRSLGPMTDIGFGIGGSFFNDYRNALIQQWNFNIQRQLPGNMVFEISYLGNRGIYLPDGDGGRSFNQLPASFMQLGTTLLKVVDNPFYGVITDSRSRLSKKRIPLNRLLRPYPQYSSLGASRKPNASSTYHAMTIRVDKRFSHGLSFLLAYTAGKLMDDASSTVSFLGPIAGSRLDHYNRKLEWAVSSMDVAQRAVLSFVYELPFGRGKRFASGASGVLNTIITGWQANGILTFASGTPIFIKGVPNNTGIFSGQRANNNGRSAKITGGTTDERIQEWFDTSVFSLPEPYTFGNVGRTLPDVRNPGTQNVDLSFFKNTYVGPEGRLNVQFRVEMFNAFNTPQFGTPNNNIRSGGFGKITRLAAQPRQIQLALKLIW